MPINKNKKLKKEEDDEQEEEIVEKNKNSKKTKEQDEEDESSEDDDDDESMDSGDDEDDDEDDEEDDNGEEINVDFEARAIREADKDSIASLLNQKWSCFNTSKYCGHIPVSRELAERVIKQENIGSVIYQSLRGGDEDDEESKEEEDDTIFGVISILDMTTPNSKGIIDFFKHKASKHSAIVQALENKKVALVVNERFVNIPGEISVPMFESLLSDLKTNKSPMAEFDHWLFMSRKLHDGQELIYLNPEEEYVDEVCAKEHKCELALENQQPHSSGLDEAEANYQQFITLYLVKPSDVNKALDKIKKQIK